MEVHPLGDDLFAVLFTGSHNAPDAGAEPMVWRVSEADLADLVGKIEKARVLARALRGTAEGKANH